VAFGPTMELDLLVGPNVFHAVLVKGDSKCL
jgi:hypothetical protein